MCLKTSNKSVPAGSKTVKISLTLPTFDATSEPVFGSHPLATSPGQAVFAPLGRSGPPGHRSHQRRPF